MPPSAATASEPSLSSHEVFALVLSSRNSVVNVLLASTWVRTIRAALLPRGTTVRLDVRRSFGLQAAERLADRRIDWHTNHHSPRRLHPAVASMSAAVRCRAPVQPLS